MSEDPKALVEGYLNECLGEFKKVIPGLDRKLHKWLLDRFRENFQLAMGNHPAAIWTKKGGWLKQQTTAMAHFAKAIAIVREHPSPDEKDLERSVELIREEQCPSGTEDTRGRYCGN